MRANERNRACIVVAPLFMFMVINFADKAVIGIAAVPMMHELELGPRQSGLVGSSFFLLFAVSLQNFAAKQFGQPLAWHFTATSLS